MYDCFTTIGILPSTSELVAGRKSDVLKEKVLLNRVNECVMKDPLIRRVRYVGLRFTREEFEKIEELRKNSTTPEISEFIRRCVFDKPITVKQRNASLDEFMQVMIGLRNDFSAIGNNFNQSVRQLNTFKEYPAVEHFIHEYEKLHGQILEKIIAIENKINEIADIWLQ